MMLSGSRRSKYEHWSAPEGNSKEGPPFLKLTSHKRGVVRYDPEDVRAYVVERRVRNTSQSDDLPQPEPSDTRVHRRR